MEKPNHNYLGLKPYGRGPIGRAMPMVMLLVAGFGFIMGTVWIGSRVSIALLVQANQAAGGADPALLRLIQDYILHYENLLWFIRFTTFATSLAYVVMVLSGRTLYPRWMAIFNPILLLITAFVLFIVAPAVGKYTLPIALNAGYFVFFALSTLVLLRVCREDAA